LAPIGGGRLGRPLLEGVATTVKGLQEALGGVQNQPTQGQTQGGFGGFEGVYRGGRLYRLPSGGVVEHGVTPSPTPPPTQGQEQGGTTPPTTGTGSGKGSGEPSGSYVPIGELQNLVMNNAKETLSNLNGYNAQNFVQIMNDLKYTDPKLYDQLMRNPTIKEAYEKASNYLLTHYGWNPEAFGGADVGDLISRLLGVSSGSQATSEAIRDIASGNWQAAHDKLSKLKALLDLCEVNKKACSMLSSWGYNKETINKLYDYSSAGLIQQQIQSILPSLNTDIQKGNFSDATKEAEKVKTLLEEMYTYLQGAGTFCLKYSLK
jgi:hypothetical protein